MITSEPVYWLIGIVLLAFGALVFADRTNPRRFTSGLFWTLVGGSFLYGTWVAANAVPPWKLGVVVLVIVGLGSSGSLLRAGSGSTTTPQERERGAERFGNRLFVPALVIPLVTVIVTLAAPALRIGGEPLIAEGSATLVGLGLGAVIAVVVGLVLLRPVSPLVPVQEGRRLLETIGWAVILPQMLSVLGILFAQAGVGTAVGDIMTAIVPSGVLILAVVAYCVGMALFTILMGNAFAAFPIMTAALGWPLLVEGFGGNPAVIFAIGMLAGFCGTLCTPMAANFNMVPAVLLEMKNGYGVILAQLPTAGILLVANIALMYAFGFPH